MWWPVLLFAGFYYNSIVYWLLYYLFYKFSGAHNKPTSDSKYDPKVEHQTSLWYRLLRSFEASYKLDAPDSPDTRAQQTVPLREISSVNPELFSLLTSEKTEPVVIRDLLKDTPAVKKWGPQYFVDNYGSTKLLTLARSDKFSNHNAYTNFNESLDFQNMKLGVSIKNMLDSSGGDSGNSVYVNNVTSIFREHPELVNDLDLTQISYLDRHYQANDWLKINLFMGGRNTGSSLHCAVGGNFFFNVHGQKKWVLIHPKYSRYLRSTPAKNFSFVISGYDIEHPSEILDKIPKYTVTLNPGDVLYIPPWWWHYVKNESDFTIGCSVRDHTAYYQSFYNNFMYMMMSPYPLRLNPWLLKALQLIKGRDYLLKKSLESDRHIVSNLTNYHV